MAIIPVLEWGALSPMYCAFVLADVDSIIRVYFFAKQILGTNVRSAFVCGVLAPDKLGAQLPCWIPG